MLSQRWPFLDVRQTHSSCLWVESNRVVLHLDLVAMRCTRSSDCTAQRHSPAHQQLYQMIKCLIWSGEKCSCSLKLFYGYVPSAQPNTWHDSILLCLLHRIEFRFLNKLKISHYIFRYIEKRYVSQLQPHSLRWVPTWFWIIISNISKDKGSFSFMNYY